MIKNDIERFQIQFNVNLNIINFAGLTARNSDDYLIVDISSYLHLFSSWVRKQQEGKQPDKQEFFKHENIFIL